MAAKKRTTPRNSRNSKTITPETAWSYWMQLGEAQSWQDLDTALIRRYSEVFGAAHPAWLIRANPLRRIYGDKFRFYRETILRLTREQCAAYLQVSRTTIGRWESESEPVPFAAFEVLRLQSESPFFKLSHALWDGWYVDHDGAVVSPRIGKVGFMPADLEAYPHILAQLEILKTERDAMTRRLNTLETENAALRAGRKVKAVTGELASMQARITEILGTLQTADVLSFPTQIAAEPARKVST